MADGAGWSGLSALQAACWRPWAVARLGREEGLEVNSQGFAGYTSLTTAAFNGIRPVSPPPLYLPQVTWTVSRS